MKLLATISLFLCSFFIREQVIASVGACRWKTVCKLTNDREKVVSKLVTSFEFDAVPLFDDDDNDDEFTLGRKNIRLYCSLNTTRDLHPIRHPRSSCFNPGFSFNGYFLPGAEICIFQRVIRI